MAHHPRYPRRRRPMPRPMEWMNYPQPKRYRWRDGDSECVVDRGVVLTPRQAESWRMIRDTQCDFIAPTEMLIRSPYGPMLCFAPVTVQWAVS